MTAVETEQALSLTIIVPVYNEARTLRAVFERVWAVDVGMPRQIILVNDGSIDGSAAIMDEIAAAHGDSVTSVHHTHNQGKGAAICTALALASGTTMLIQDADLEYDPQDYPALLAPICRGQAQIVFGTRAFRSHTAYSFWFVMGNKLVTLAANILFNAYLSDVETCYKVIPTAIARALNLTSRGFEIEVEITAKLLRMGCRVYEVPIDYVARTRDEGKKLQWRDGVRAIWHLLRYRFWIGS